METIVVLMVVGALLLAAEVFLPGLIAGIAGIGCLVAAIVMSYVEFGVKTGNAILFFVFGVLAVLTIIWLKLFPNSRAAKPFISEKIIGSLGVERPDLLDQTGSAFTDLRPSGTAVINGQRVDVVAENRLIAKGTSIKVIQVEGARVVVRAVQEN